MNKGLNKKTTQYTTGIGDISVLSNLCEEDSNIHLIVPLMNTNGVRPLEIELVYNEQESTELSEFGYGFKLNLYNEIKSISTNFIDVKDCAGEVHSYTRVEENNNDGIVRYENQDTKLMIEVSSTYDEEESEIICYDFVDRAQNRILYTDENYKYMKSSSPKSLDNKFLDFYDNGDIKKYSNLDGLYFSFEKNSNGLIEVIKYMNNLDELERVELSYENSRLVGIVTKRATKIIKSYTIDYLNEETIITNNITNENLKLIINHEFNRLTGIVRGKNSIYKNVSTSILYDSPRTEVINELGQKHVYVFNSRKLMYEIDHHNNIKTYSYKPNKDIKLSENIFHNNYINNDRNLVPNLKIRDFRASCQYNYNEFEHYYDHYNVLFGSLVERVVVNGDTTFTYTKNIKLNFDDEIALIMWIKCDYGYNDDEYCSVSLSTAYESSTTILTSSTYHPVVVGLVASRSCGYVRISLNCVGINTISIGKIALVKMSSGTTYEYDSDDNLIRVISKNKRASYKYNDMNMVEDFVVNDRICKYEYDTKNNIVKKVDANGLTTEITYDGKNRIIDRVISNKTRGKKHKTLNIYYDDHYTYSSDELLNATKCRTDNYGNVIYIENELLERLNLNYENGYLLLSQILQNDTNNKKISYDYYNNNLLKTVTITDNTNASNNGVYTYEYDEYFNLLRIFNNNIKLIEYEYDVYDRVTKIINSDNTNIIISYNNGDIASITEGDTVYRYEYTIEGKLLKVKKNDVEIRSYEYDNCFNLIKEKIGNNYIEYGYSDYGLTQVDRNIENKSIVERCDSTDLVKQNYPQNIKHIFYDDFLTCMFYEETPRLSGCGVWYLEANSTNSYVYEGGIPCCDTSIAPLYYYLANSHQTKGSYGMWVKLKGDVNNQPLLSISSYLPEVSYGNINIGTNDYGQIRINILGLNYGSEYETIIQTKNKLRNEWSFIGFTWENVGGVTKMDLLFDGMIYHNEINYNMYFSEGMQMDVGLGCDAYIAGLFCSHENKVDIEKINEYYTITKMRLISNEEMDIITDRYSCITYKNEVGLDLFPLDNSLSSIRGVKPVIAERGNTFNMYVYNSSAKCFMYNPDRRLLKYDLGVENELTIGMDIYLDVAFEDNQTILELSDTYYSIRLYVDTNCRLLFEYEGYNYYTGFNIDKKELAFIGFSIEKVDIDEDGCNLYNYYVYKNDLVYSNSFYSYFETYDCELTLGRRSSTTNYEPLYGQIGKMIVKLAGVETVAEFEGIKDSLSYATVVSESDEFGLEKTKTILNQNQDIIYNNSKIYKVRAEDTGNAGDAAYSSPCISREVYQLNGISFVRSYSYDGLYRVTRVDNNIDGINDHTYTYDLNGYLLSDNDEIYEYDRNGNITRLASMTFEYQNGYKDKLTKACGYDVIYDNSNPLYPKSWNGRSYTWNNGRLITYQYNGETVEFTYNEKGLRSSKKKNNITTNYYYHNDRLITEINNNYRIDYIYDQSNIIVGFIYNDSTYYYVRDCLQNIIGIIDSNGSLIVKYNYNAYGNNMTITGNTNIGNINPFRYKGYYYDVETGLFYVTSRYYSPELGRFIQPADVSTLNPSSINGLNLYSYANNNPISIAYSSSNVSFGASGGMIGSTGGTIGKIVGSGSVSGGSKVSGFGSLGGSNFSGINWPKVNSVAMTHHTVSLIKDPIISGIFGNISYTTTVQLNSAETFYSFSNIGNDGYSAGVGFNFGNWYGGSLYVSSDIGFGSSWQLTPWLTGSSGWSLENGISISGGVIIGDTTHEITVSVGNGALLGYAACAGIAALPMPGARAVAATAACVIFIIDLFN